MAGRKKRARPYRKVKYAKQKERTTANKRRAKARHIKENPNDRQATE